MCVDVRARTYVCVCVYVCVYAYLTQYGTHTTHDLLEPVRLVVPDGVEEVFDACIH